MCHNDPGMTHYISGWRNGDCIFSINKLFTSVSFCSSSGLSSSAVSLSSSLSFFQSESPEQTALIFAVFPRPSKSFNICHRCICQGCCLTNWAIADDLMLVRMHSMWNDWLTLFTLVSNDR